MPQLHTRNRVGTAAAPLLVAIASGSLCPSSGLGAATRPPVTDPDFSTVLHAHIEPVAMVFTDNETRKSWAQPGVDITEEFDVYVGSNVAGGDGIGVQRLKAIWTFREFGEDKYVATVSEGYAIASGTAPILAGRRIRAASDGTQFAIEVIADASDPAKFIERVYFLNTATGQPLKIRIYTDAEQRPEGMISRELKVPGQYYEVREGAELPEEPSGTISGPKAPCDVIYFAAQMYLLLTSKQLLIEPPKVNAAAKVTSAEDIKLLLRPLTKEGTQSVFAADTANSLPRRTLMSRFFDRIQATKPAAGDSK